jgi:hypothetical protein
MFSLREVEEDQFIYRCHECGWESAPITKEEAILYPRPHHCQPTDLRPGINSPSIAS